MPQLAAMGLEQVQMLHSSWAQAPEQEQVTAHELGLGRAPEQLYLTGQQAAGFPHASLAHLQVQRASLGPRLLQALMQVPGRCLSV